MVLCLAVKSSTAANHYFHLAAASSSNVGNNSQPIPGDGGRVGMCTSGWHLDPFLATSHSRAGVLDKCDLVA